MAESTKRVYCTVSRCMRWASLDENGLCPRHVALAAKAKGDIIYKCLECDTECTKGQRALLCDRCCFWTHASCTEVDDEVYDIFFEKGSKLACFRYFCKKCDNKVTEALEKYDKLEQDTQLLKSEMKVVQDKVEKIEETIKTTVRDKISDVMEDQREVDKRKMNLIVFGLPEIELGQDTVWNTPEKVEKDIESMNKLITEELGVGLSNRNGIINARRLGGSTSKTKPRPLRIEFRDLNTKRDVLTNAKKFRDSTSDIAKQIFINPDLTEEQRKKDQVLRKEMWKQRGLGRNVIIKRGEIVETTRIVRKHRNLPDTGNPRAQVPMDD